jgi:hypothetical protein
MQGGLFMKSKIISRLVLILGFLMLAFSIAFYSQEVIRLVKWRSLGTMHSDILSGSDHQLVFSRIDTLDFKSPPYPQPDDLLLQIGDSTATFPALREQLHTNPPGQEIPLTFAHQQDTLTTTLISTPVSTSNFFWRGLSQTLRILSVWAPS